MSIEGFQEGFTQEVTFEQDLFDHRTLFYRIFLNISQHSSIVFWGILFGKSCTKMQDPLEHMKRKEDEPVSEALTGYHAKVWILCFCQ